VALRQVPKSGDRLGNRSGDKDGAIVIRWKNGVRMLQMAIRIEEHEIDKELAGKFPDRVNYKCICQHTAMLEELAKKDPKLG